LYKIEVKKQASLEKVMPVFWVEQKVPDEFCGDCKMDFYA